MVPTVHEAFIYACVRSGRGAAKPTGGLHRVKPVSLVAQLLDALTRRGLDPAAVQDVILGCNTAVGDQGANIAQTALRFAGWPHSVGGATVNRFCASGLDAVHTAAARVMSGMGELLLAGGVESMSRVPMFSDEGAWFSDPEVAAATGFLHMGVAADLLATVHHIDRASCDAYAAESHRRARAAERRDAFRCRVPIAAPAEDGSTRPFAREECVRETSVEALAKLEPAFAKVGERGGDAVAKRAYPEVDHVERVHTVGTSPAMVDAASLVLIGDVRAGERLGLRPLARVRSFAHVNVEPVMMLTGPAAAVRAACARTGLTPDDLDLVECNESFAATALLARRELGFDARPESFNPHGGGIAMGHPLGATGGILIGTLIDALQDEGGSLGAVTIPAGGGIAAATILERIG